METLEFSNRVEQKSYVLVGATVSVLISIYHSREFRLDVWSSAAFMAWYGLSVLIGGVSGHVVGELAKLFPNRFHRTVLFGAVPLVAAGGYMFQVTIFLAVMFRMTTWY